MREESGKSQGILRWMISGNPAESQLIQETPEECYYRRNIGWVSRVIAMDKTTEPPADGSSVRPIRSLSNLISESTRDFLFGESLL